VSVQPWVQPIHRSLTLCCTHGCTVTACRPASSGIGAEALTTIDGVIDGVHDQLNRA
jgi:hypothetical protein